MWNHSWWEAQQVSKEVNKATLFYVEQAMAVHIGLFYVRAQMSLFISYCSFAISELVFFVHGQSLQTKEIENKNI